MSVGDALVEVLANNGTGYFFPGPQHVLVCMKHDNGLTIILSGATALVCLETHRPRVKYRKHLSSAPTDTPCSTCHRVWAEAAEASQRCLATQNKAVGLSKYHKTTTHPSRPSLQKTKSPQNCPFVKMDRTR